MTRLVPTLFMAALLQACGNMEKRPQGDNCSKSSSQNQPSYSMGHATYNQKHSILDCAQVARLRPESRDLCGDLKRDYQVQGWADLPRAQQHIQSCIERKNEFTQMIDELRRSCGFR